MVSLWCRECRKGVWAGVLAALLCGCGGNSGPDLEDVSGTVTLDGEPLPEATVRFLPESDGTAEYVRPATGVTDSSGWYSLSYSSSRDGALPGKYRVAITTYREGGYDEDEEGNPIPGAPEKVPSAYNSETTLTVTVPSDSYDFELKSGAGEVVQPQQTGEEFGEEF